MIPPSSPQPSSFIMAFSNMIYYLMLSLFLFQFTSCEENVDTRYPTTTAPSSSNAQTQTTNGSSIITNPKYENKISGKAVKIADGDTFTLLFNNGFEVRVRLDGIDTPEKRQSFSGVAKKALSNLIFKKQVEVYYNKKDGYGRVLGEIHINGLIVNQELLRQGLAWHYIKYSDDEHLALLEKIARENKIGLWQDPNPIAPWNFRKK